MFFGFEVIKGQSVNQSIGYGAPTYPPQGPRQSKKVQSICKKMLLLVSNNTYIYIGCPTNS